MLACGSQGGTGSVRDSAAANLVVAGRSAHFEANRELFEGRADAGTKPCAEHGALHHRGC